MLLMGHLALNYEELVPDKTYFKRNITTIKETLWERGIINADGTRPTYLATKQAIERVEKKRIAAGLPISGYSRKDTSQTNLTYAPPELLAPSSGLVGNSVPLELLDQFSRYMFENYDTLYIEMLIGKVVDLPSLRHLLLTLTPPLGVGVGQVSLLQSGDTLKALTRQEGLLDIRLKKLGAWFASAKHVDDGLEDGFPTMNSQLDWRTEIVSVTDKGIATRVSGWVWLGTADVASPSQIAYALKDAYHFERKQIFNQLDDLERREADFGKAGMMSELARIDFSAVKQKLLAMKRQASFAIYFSTFVPTSGELVFGDGSKMPSVLGQTYPWRDAAVTLNRVGASQVAALQLKPGQWAWAPDRDAPKTRSAFVFNQDPVVDDLVARLLLPEGEELGARFARVSARFDRCEPKSRSDYQLSSDATAESEEQLFPLSAAGEPDTRRSSFLSLTSEARGKSFGGENFESTSAGSSRFHLPVGSVVVWPRGEPPYLRGRGWRVFGSGSLRAWNITCEPGLVPIDIEKAELHGWVGYRGQRWWNVNGDGTLWDETLFEREDRRLRTRQRAWEAIDSRANTGSPGLSPSEWRWLYFNLIGHYFGPEDWRMANGQWRWPKGFGPDKKFAVTQQLSFSSGPNSAPTEWQDSRHDRKWAGDFLPDTLRGHVILRSLERRAGGSTEPFLALLLAATKDLVHRMGQHAQGTDRRKAFEALLQTALGGQTYFDFWRRVEAQQHFDAVKRNQWEEEVEAHRHWMTTNALIAVVPDPKDEGSNARLRFETWRPDFQPEPFVIPACMQVPAAPGGVGYDFTQDVDQGYGTTDKPDESMQPHYVKGMVLPEAHRQIDHNANRLLDKNSDEGRQNVLTACSLDSQEDVEAEAKSRNETTEEFYNREMLLTKELELLLFGQDVLPAGLKETNTGNTDSATIQQARKTGKEAASRRVHLKEPLSTRPVGLTVPKSSQRAMPSIRLVPGSFRQGLNFEQNLFLTEACSGRHLRVTAPGGVGKTLVLIRYASVRLHADSQSAVIICVTPDQRSKLRTVCSCFDPDALPELVTAISTARGAGKKICLIIDEYASLSTQLVSLALDVEQVVFTGDIAQGSFDYDEALASAMASQLRCSHITLTSVWRANNQLLFSSQNMLAYGGRYEAISLGSGIGIESLRTRQIAEMGTRLPLAAAAALRLMRHALVNRGNSTTLLISDRLDMIIATAFLAHIPFKQEHALTTLISFLHPAQLNGIETDVLVATGPAVGSSRREAEVRAITILGRPRFRIELLSRRSGPAEEGWLEDILRNSVIGHPPRQDDDSFSTFRSALEARGAKLRLGLSFATVLSTRTGEVLSSIIFVEGYLRTDLERLALAISKKHRGHLVAPEILQNNCFSLAVYGCKSFVDKLVRE